MFDSVSGQLGERWIHVVRLDLDAAYREPFMDWYSEVHIPAVLARPGWDAAHRYICLGGEPRELVIFDLDPVAVGDEAPSASPLAAYPEDHRIRNYLARTMRPISTRGADPREAELINLVTTEVTARAAAAFNAWYDEVHVPEIVECPGWLGNERYEGVDGEPRFMAVYGLADEETPFHSAAYEAAVGWDEFVTELRGYHGFRIFRKAESVGA